MALIATFSDGGTTINNAVVKISSIWGSKSQGWNAWVSVLESKSSDVVMSTFSVHADYVDGVNPYPELYAAAAKSSLLTNVKSDENKKTDDDGQKPAPQKRKRKA